MEQPQPLSGIQYNPAILQANENSKTCIENTVTTTQVRQPQGEIEEEVATLLLDIFRKASPALEDQQQEKEGTRPLLLSPKPIKKSSSKTLLEFGVEDDLSFRRRKSPGSLSPKEDILELYNNVDEEKKRKMKSEGDFRAPEDPAHENEEEGPEEDEKEEAEWTQQDPDDDDYYEEDLDDDEWLEARGYAGSPSSGVMTSPNMNNSRIPRKKAPSGSACEKHKRWKKRCPDDCPMRKPKHRKGKFGEYSKFEMDGMGMIPPFEHASEIAKSLGRSPSPKVTVATSPIAPPSPPPKDPSTVNVIAAAMSVNSSKADFVSLISWSLNQLKKESFGTLTSEDIHQIELQLLQKTNVDPTDCALSEFEAGMDLEFDYRARAKKLKMSEERRAIFVGPSDPALRKTPKNLNSGARSKRTREESYENDLYQEDLEPISSPEQSMDNSDMNITPPHFRLHKAYSADDLPKSPRIQLKALNAVEIKLDLSKDKKSPKNARRTGRKYLPQACDRHKLLHAKCPANCPDRIRRDQEMAKNPDVIMTN